MNLVSSFILACIIGTVGLAGVVFYSSKEYNSNFESTYGFKIAKTEGSLLSQNRIIIEREGQQFRCNQPSVGEVKNKTALTCDNTLKIEAK